MILKGKGHHVFLQIFYLFFWAVQVMVWGWERCTNYHKIFLDDFSQPKILHILMRRIVEEVSRYIVSNQVRSLKLIFTVCIFQNRQCRDQATHPREAFFYTLPCHFYLIRCQLNVVVSVILPGWVTLNKSQWRASLTQISPGPYKAKLARCNDRKWNSWWWWWPFKKCSTFIEIKIELWSLLLLPPGITKWMHFKMIKENGFLIF